MTNTAVELHLFRAEYESACVYFTKWIQRSVILKALQTRRIKATEEIQAPNEGLFQTLPFQSDNQPPSFRKTAPNAAII